jgi:CelD/BcsL family acetyltransferase involved in cellulose biosynthesis
VTSRIDLIDTESPSVEVIWRDLERAASPPYFLTWGWVENWLAMLPRDERPALAVIRDDGAIAGAFFLGKRRLVRHHLLPSRGSFVNATGVPRHDELCIEHNGVLSAASSAWTLARLIELLPGDWDELFLPGVDRETFRDLAVPAGYRVRVEREAPSPFVELGRVRQAGDYLNVLSANTRAQIRRARRRLGACELEIADSLDAARELYDELVSLHAASWRARGESGAFADPWFDRFHRRLIEHRFAHGEIQLVRLRAGAATVGCLYNLLAGGRVLFYQSGLASFDDPVIKPGLLCHAAAVARCAEAGHEVYDLLGGSSRYKASLATATAPLVWLRVQRARLRFAVEDRVRAWKHSLAGRLA